MDIFNTTVTTTLPDTNTTTMSADARKRLLGIINLKETIKFAPVLAFYVFIMIIGLIGNSFVLYIYKFKFKRTSARTYILCLGLLDFLVCSIGIPYHVLDLTYVVTYHHIEICKSLSFLIGAVNLSSVFVLIVISVDRYLKVCRPLKKQLIDFGDRLACAIAIVCAIIISVPNAILYGASTVVHEGVSGVECFIDDQFAESLFAIAYLGFYILVFIICIFSLIVIYMFICREIYRNQAFHTTVETSEHSHGCCNWRRAYDDDSDAGSDWSGDQRDTAAETMMSEVFSEDGKDDEINKQKPEDTDKGKTDNVPQNDSRDETADTVREALIKKPEVSETKTNTKTDHAPQNKTIATSNKTKKHKSVKPSKSNVLVRHTTKGTSEKHTRKITLMMLTITIVFIISYLPFIIISLADSSDIDYWKDMTTSQQVFTDFMLRFYLINNMANAIIYSFWDERFRREVILIIIKLCCCCCKRKRQRKR